jgi:hypothetical protein
MQLEAIHLVDDGVYIVSRAWGYEYEVDGLTVPTGSEIVVTDPARLVRVERRSGPVLAWQDAQGNLLPNEIYEAQKQVLLEGSARDDEGELTFPDLDAEFEYRKFVARWAIPQRGPEVVERTPVDLKVVEVRVNSGDPDIVSLWNAPHVVRDASLYQFDRTAYLRRTVRELAEASGLAVDIPTHSGVRFAKLDNEYAFNDSFDTSRGNLFIGTLQQCKDEKQKWHSRVAEIVNRHAIKKSGKPLTNAGDVLLALSDLRARLANVAPKGRSSESELGAVRKRIGDLITTIQGAA